MSSLPNVQLYGALDFPREAPKITLRPNGLDTVSQLWQNQNALAFAQRHAGWHTYAQDRRTAIAIGRLAIKGLVIVNQYRQFTLASQLVVN